VKKPWTLAVATSAAIVTWAAARMFAVRTSNASSVIAFVIAAASLLRKWLSVAYGLPGKFAMAASFDCVDDSC